MTVFLAVKNDEKENMGSSHPRTLTYMLLHFTCGLYHHSFCSSNAHPKRSFL